MQKPIPGIVPMEGTKTENQMKRDANILKQGDEYTPRKWG